MHVDEACVVGPAASSMIGLLGYAVGAPVEAVLAALVAGSVTKVLVFDDRRDWAYGSFEYASMARTSGIQI